jgi:hypothetical protein
MSQYVPAQPGWFVLSIVGGVESRRDPIIAWKIESDEVGPLPITSSRVQTPLDANHVIVTPEGRVVTDNPGQGTPDNVESYLHRMLLTEDKKEELEQNEKKGRLITSRLTGGSPLFREEETGPFKTR